MVLVTSYATTLQPRSYEIVDVLFRNGSSSELDALQARTLLLSTEATIPELEATLQQAKNALSVLLGVAPARLEQTFDGKGEVGRIRAVLFLDFWRGTNVRYIDENDR